VLRQNHANRFAPDRIYDPASHRVLRYQARRPPRASFGRWATHQRHHSRLLRTVELRDAARTRLFAECILYTFVEVPPHDSPTLARIRAQSRRRCVDRHPAVEHEQRLDPSPDSLAQLLAASLQQLLAIRCRKLQPLESLRSLHPML
jgi:hypothetical protein